jgi:hypothetical protein
LYTYIDNEVGYGLFSEEDNTFGSKTGCTIIWTHVGFNVGKYVGTHVQTKIFSGWCWAPPHWSFLPLEPVLLDFVVLLDLVLNVDPPEPDVNPAPVPAFKVIASNGETPSRDEPELGPFQDDPPPDDNPDPVPVLGVVPDNGALPNEDELELGPFQDDPELGPLHDEPQLGASM